MRRLSGHFYLLAFVALFFTAAVGLVAYRAGRAYWLPALGLLPLNAAIVVARGLVRLRPWALRAAAVLGVLLLPAVPLGTMLGLEALHVVARHGRATDERYREVVAMTPSLDDEDVARWQWVVIALLVAAIPVVIYLLW